MIEQRRHPRVRFPEPPPVRLGQAGQRGIGAIENLSLSGIMLRTELSLAIGQTVGCEFSVFGSPRIDIPATVVSKIGDVYGARFSPGPISEVLIGEAIDGALDQGKASVLTYHESEGRKVMRVCGGLNASLRGDFLHGVTQVRVSQIDLSGVRTIDADGVALCRLASEKHGILIDPVSPCVAAAWQPADRPRDAA